jgi:Carbohydrate family 9 binding domain-like
MKNILSLAIFSCLALGCAEVKHLDLYEVNTVDNTPSIKGFEALNIYSDQLTTELWYTQMPTCVNVKAENIATRSGTGALSIEWNKQAGGCPWLGLGIGWDNWTGKDFSQITNDAALSFWVKTKGGNYKGLPWAVGFEDFSDGQAWTGLTSDLVVGGLITDQWTQVIVPLENFPFEGFDVDASAIKQVIFQFESSGKVFVDDISIIPHKAKGRQQLAVNKIMAPSLDGNVDAGEWAGTFIQLGDAKINIDYDNQNIYVAAIVTDSSPAINKQDNENIWNGDAIEIAFSTAPDVDPKRRIFYDTDHHLGFKLGNDAMVYNWSAGKKVEGATIKIVRTTNGYTMEAAVPWSALKAMPWEAGKNYDLEVALDMGNEEGMRTEQLRWNSAGREGFNTNPSYWGQMMIVP